MRLYRPFAILALVLVAVLSPAAEVVTAKLAKKSNVRYGPSKSAASAVVLPADTELELLGRITKDDGVWYQVRFPREGKAWMHIKNLKDLGNNVYEVTGDKSRVRDDATGGANIVAELNKGDTVEFRANRVGDWLAVYPAKAVAYVHESVLAVPQTPVGPAVVGQRPVERLWGTAKDTYQRYAGTPDLKTALTLDWQGLSLQLGQVAKEHPELSVRLEAARLKNGVDAVVAAQTKQNAHATVSVPQPPAEPVAPIPGPSLPGNPPVPNPDAPAGAASLEVQQVMGPQSPVPATGTYIVQGILEQKGEVFLVFNNSKVIAILQAKPGATLQLSDYYWREIGVKGMSPGTGKDDQGNEVPIVLVDDVELLKR